MILKNNLYTITETRKEEGSAEYTVTLNPECFIYKAHFPDYPITPGVCLVQMAAELIGETVGTAVGISGVKNAKFLVPVKPDGKALTVKVTNIKETESPGISAQVTILGADGNIYARISVETVAA